MRWLLAAPLLAFGLIAHLQTLAVAFTFIRDCLVQGSFQRRTGMPLLGPLLISLGLGVCPLSFHTWALVVPWGLEGLAVLVAWVIQKATRAGAR